MAIYNVPAVEAASFAIVIGNGPSLRGVDLHKFSSHVTFGMNVAYRHWRDIEWFPRNYSCLDEVVGLSHADEIGRLIKDNRAGRPAPSAFCLRRNLIEVLGTLGRDNSVTCFDDLVDADPRFYRPPVTTGSHTLLWALSRGFQRLFLIGVDARYVEVVPGARSVSENVLEIASEAENPNYYLSNYQRPGDRYHRPNITTGAHVRSWRVAASGAAEREAEVYNLSQGSSVDAFDFCSLDDLLEGRDLVVRSAATVRCEQLRHP